MPLEPLSESPQFLSGRFWPISIRKTDLGPDLGNFYPDAGYGIFFSLDATYGIPGAQFSFFLLGLGIRVMHLRHYSNISTI
jgi:hypothetical protein